MKFEKTDPNASGTSLSNYVEASYAQLVSLFGAPSYNETSADDKVDVEWVLANEEGQVVTIYNWKDYDGGHRARSSLSYRWHIGSRGGIEALELVNYINSQTLKGEVIA